MLVGRTTTELSHWCSGRPPEFENEAPGEMSRERLMECAARDPKWRATRGEGKGKL
jgi:hypothetical protein